MEKLIWRLASAALALILAGCGGGEGGSGGSGNGMAVTSTTLSGVAVDGYLSKANACLDLNDNGVCDTNEPLTQTDNLGKYTLIAPNLDAANNHHVLIEVVSGVTIDADNPATPVTAGYTLTAAIGSHGVVSPISTLMNAWQQLYPGLNTADMLQMVRQNLGFSNSLDLTADFAASNSTDEQKLLHNVARAIPLIVSSSLTKIQTALGHPLSATEKQQAMAWIDEFLWTCMPNLIYQINYGSNVSQAANQQSIDIANIAGKLSAASIKTQQMASPMSLIVSGYDIAAYSDSSTPAIFSYASQPGSTTSHINFLSTNYFWNSSSSTFVANYNAQMFLNNGVWVTSPGNGPSTCSLTPIAMGAHFNCDNGFESDEYWGAFDLSGINIDGYLGVVLGKDGATAWKVAPDKTFSNGASGYINFDKVTKDLYQLYGGLSSFTGSNVSSTFLSLDSAMQATTTNGTNHYQLGNLNISFDTVTGTQGNLSLYLSTTVNEIRLPLKGTWTRYTVGQVDLIEFTIPDAYQSQLQQSFSAKYGWSLYQGNVVSFIHTLPGAMFLTVGELNHQAISDLKTYQGSAH